jgi:hypothetical protein
MRKEVLSLSKTPSELLRVLALRPFSQLRAVIFLDVDRDIACLTEFSRNPQLFPFYHFVVFVSLGFFPEVLTEYIEEEWLTLIVSPSEKRRSMENDYILSVSSVNHAFCSHNTPFFLVSNSEFVIQVERRTEEFGYRRCLVIFPSKLFQWIISDFREQRV